MTALTEHGDEGLERFLLGLFQEDERLELESLFTSDAVLFERIRKVEAALIEDYWERRLTPQQSGRFESAYLARGPRRERALVTRALMDRAVARRGARRSGASSRFRAVRYWAAAAVLVLALGSTWLSLRNLAPPGQVGAPSALRLSPRLTRGEAAEVVVANAAHDATLELLLDKAAAPTYAVIVQSVEGETVWKGLGALEKGADDRSWVRVVIPRGALPRGDYILVVAAEPANGRSEIAGHYFIRMSAESTK